MMSRTQLRMARAALNWTLNDLAKHAGVNLNTISRYEVGGSMLTDTLERIETALRAAGITFIDEDERLGPGVRAPKAATGAPAEKAKRSRRSRKSARAKK